jgi:membrane protease YdiL (CAAX protease family)
MNKKPIIPQGWLRALFFILLSFPIAVFIGFGIDILLNGKYAYDYANGSVPISGFLVQYISNNIGFVIIVPFFRYVIDNKSFGSLGFQWKKHQTDAFMGLFIAMAILFTGALILAVTKNLYFTNAFFNLNNFLTAITLYAIVAFIEETVFRGYILNNLMQSINRWPALIIVSLLFALLHLQNGNINALAFLNIFLGGLLLGMNYIFTGNLWFGIFLHFGWNFFQGSVLGFNISGTGIEQGTSILQQTIIGPTYFTGGNFGFEGSVICTILSLAMFIIISSTYNRKESLARAYKQMTGKDDLFQ